MKRTAARGLWLPCACAALVACAWPRAGGEGRSPVSLEDVDAAAGPRWRAVVAPARDASSLSVTLCFDGERPRRLAPEDRRALAHLRRVEWVDGARRGALRIDGRGVDLLGLPGTACLAYEVDLEAAARASGRPEGAVRVGRDMLTSPDVWLLRAEPAGEGELRFALQEGMAVAAPWPARDEQGGRVYQVDETTFRSRSHVAFGRFVPDVVDVAGARISIALLDGPRRATREGVRRWIEAAARAVASPTGRFPVDRLQVIVRPVDGVGRPVVFGMVARGGGATAYLALSRGAADDALPGDWVAVHELSHLLLPPVRSADAWLYEGVASYAQNVLRGRAGLLSEADAWQELVDGFGRGRRAGGGGTLAEASEAMRRTFAYHRVYWSGAAYALLLDAALLQESGGSAGLFSALQRVRDRLPSERRSPAALVLRVLEEETGSHAPRALYEQIVLAEGFPAVEPLFQRLGVRLEGGRVVLDDAAPLAPIRRAIASPAATPEEK